jgi:hypothetical protein
VADLEKAREEEQKKIDEGKTSHHVNVITMAYSLTFTL